MNISIRLWIDWPIYIKECKIALSKMPLHFKIFTEKLLKYFTYIFFIQGKREKYDEIWQCKMLFNQHLDSHIPIGAKIDRRSLSNDRGRSFKLLVGGQSYEMTCLSVYAVYRKKYYVNLSSKMVVIFSIFYLRLSCIN